MSPLGNENAYSVGVVMVQRKGVEMKKWVRWAFYATLITISIVWGITQHGWMQTVSNMSLFCTFYLIAMGVIEFLNWGIRYRRIKRFQRDDPGLLYLVLVREQFDNLR